MIGTEAVTERIKDFMPDPTWMSKVKAWKLIIRQTCPFKGGNGGLYCLWVGHSCSYQGCPRRIFEEGAVDKGLVDNYESAEVDRRMKNLDKSLNSMKNIVREASGILKELKEEKAKVSA